MRLPMHNDERRLNGHEATLHQVAREAEAGATFRMALDMDGCRRRKQEWLACAGGGGTEERRGKVSRRRRLSGSIVYRVRRGHRL
jgi:hypothetical protein